MNQEQIDKLIKTTHMMSYILGIASFLLDKHMSDLPEIEKQGLYWVQTAIENVIYRDIPLPENNSVKPNK